MHGGHSTLVGSCGHVIATCKCPGPKPTRTATHPCPDCERRESAGRFTEEQIIVRGKEPREIVPVLLNELQARDPDRAQWFEDAWEEVLREMRRDEITDPTMAQDCLMAVALRLSAAAPENLIFEKRDDAWGFWLVPALA